MSIFSWIKNCFRSDGDIQVMSDDLHIQQICSEVFKSGKTIVGHVDDDGILHTKELD